MNYTHPDFDIIETMMAEYYEPYEPVSSKLIKLIRDRFSDDHIKNADEEILNRIKHDITSVYEKMLSNKSVDFFKHLVNVISKNYEKFIIEYNEETFFGRPIKILIGPNVLIKSQSKYVDTNKVYKGINDGYNLLTIINSLKINEWTHYSYKIDEHPPFKCIPFIYSLEIPELMADDIPEYEIVNQAISVYDSEKFRKYIMGKLEEKNISALDNISRFSNLVDIANTLLVKKMNQFKLDVDKLYKDFDTAIVIIKNPIEEILKTDDSAKSYLDLVWEADSKLEALFPRKTLKKSVSRLLGDITFDPNELKSTLVKRIISWAGNHYAYEHQHLDYVIDLVKPLSDEGILKLNQFRRLVGLFENQYRHNGTKIYRIQEDGSNEVLEELGVLVNSILCDRKLLTKEDIDFIIESYTGDGIIGTFSDELNKDKSIKLDVGSIISNFV